MPNTSELSGFITKWRDLDGYIAQHKLSAAAANQVYNLDYSRLQSGTSYQLSKSEALDAIQSATQGSPVTQAPPQPFSAGRIPGYVGQGVQQLGTGLFGLIKKGISDVIHPMNGPHELEALWRDPKVLRDPLSALIHDPFAAAAPFSFLPGFPGSKKLDTALGQSPFLSAVVPGVADLYAAQQGRSGIMSLAENPVMTILDVLPELRVVGSGGRFLARAGLDEGTRAALEEAAKYHPTDVSNEARAARAQAQAAVSNAVRRALATNNHGLIGAMHRLVLETPFKGDTLGERISTKITQSTRGQLGPAASAAGRMVQITRRKLAAGTRDIVTTNRDFYQRNGLRSEKEVRDFTWVATHYRDDWATAYADRFDPGEQMKLENAFRDYDELLKVETQKDLANERLGMVVDPRTGRGEIRGTVGTDATVISRYNDYLARVGKADGVFRDLAELTGNDIPRDASGAAQALLVYLTQAVLEPAKAFLQVDGRDETQVRRQFPPTKPVGAENVDPHDQAAVRDLLQRGMKPGNLRWRREEVMRVGRLFGPAGLFPHLAAAVQTGRLEDAARILAQIEKLMKTTYGKTSPAVAKILPDVTRARAVLKYALRPSTKKAIDAFVKSRAALERAIDRNPEARFAPRMTEIVQQKLMETLDGEDVSPEDYKLVSDQIANGIWNGETFESIIGPKEWNKLVNSGLKQLAKERDEGLAPKFVYSTTGSDIEHLGHVPAPERISVTRSTKTRARFNPSVVYDAVLGLTRKQVDDLTEQVNTEMFFGEQGIQRRFGMSRDEQIANALQLAKIDTDDPAKQRLALDAWSRERYATIDPNAYLLTRRSSAVTGTAPAAPITVPLEFKQALDATYKSLQGPKDVALRAYSGGTRLFRWSLLNFSPRYQVHIWAGGSMLLMMRAPLGPFSMAKVLPAAMGMMIQDSRGLLQRLDNPDVHRILGPAFEHMKQAAIRRGERNGMPLGLSHELPEADPQVLTNDFTLASGKKMGGWYKEALNRRGIVDAPLHFASFGANLLRSMAYLIGKEKSAGDIDAGLRFAVKVFADMDGMTPFERSIIRYAMPFYGWTKHILQYAFTYPIDHPYRAAVLSQMINQEWEDWNTGIPQSLMYLFQIGGVDAAGNVQAVDIRQLDPLRSVWDPLTFVGFIGELNPAIQSVALPALGINPATGGPENLYPTLTINSFYGNEQPTPNTWSSVLSNGIAGYVPQATALEQALGTSSYARYTKQNDPNAYRQAIGNALGVPWWPETISLPTVQAKTEIDRYNVARDAATAAMNDPNPNSPQWKALMGYGYVPYQGWMVQPSALRQWAFDTAIRQGLVTGSGSNIQATIAPSNIVTPPYGPTIR